jgi:ribosomal protein S16
MLMNRLARFGKTKNQLRLCSEKSRDTKGTYLESLGWYNPSAQSANLEINAERVK